MTNSFKTAQDMNKEIQLFFFLILREVEKPDFAGFNLQNKGPLTSTKHAQTLGITQGNQSRF